MLILGIDPGVASTGWAVVSEAAIQPASKQIKNKKDAKQLDGQTVCFGTIKTKAGIPMPERLAKIYCELNKIIHKFKPDICAIEEIYFGKNAKTAMMVGQSRGVAVLAAVNAKMKIAEFTPLQVKTAITGYGRAEKMQMQKMVQKLLGLSELPKPDDAADALAVAICYTATREVQSAKCKVKS